MLEKIVQLICMQYNPGTEWWIWSHHQDSLEEGDMDKSQYDDDGSLT